MYQIEFDTVRLHNDMHTKICVTKAGSYNRKGNVEYQDFEVY